MKAAVLHAPFDLRIEDVPKPEVKPGYVVLRVRAAGICRTDLEIYRGAGTPEELGLKGGLPAILGHEFSGEVSEIGEDVKGFKPGDRVTCECIIGCGVCSYCLSGKYNLCPNTLGFSNGAFAEFTAVPAKGLHKLPDNVSFEEGAVTEPTAVSVYAIERAEIKPGDTVAILGAGTMGFLCLQVARAFGADRVLLTGTRDERLELGVKLGADLTINVRREDPVKRILKETEGQGVDSVIIAAAGDPGVLGRAIKIVRRGGHIAVIGLAGRKPSQLLSDEIVFKDLTIRGVYASPNTWKTALYLMKKNLVKPREIITHRFPLEKAPEAFRLLDERKGVKVILMA